MMPIWNNREKVGEAATAQAARRKLRKILDIKPGFVLHVWQRQTDIVNLPSGWVYSIEWTGKK